MSQHDSSSSCGCGCDTSGGSGFPWAVLAVVAAVAFGLALLYSSIVERRAESTNVRPLQQIAKHESDSAKWAVNWPQEYSSYKEMDRTDTKTRWGGAFKRDLLEETPANVVLFAGYPFSVDYKQARGHTHAVRDVLETGRDISTKPGTCWTCKSPDVPRLMAGKGPAAFYATPAKDLAPEIRHPIGCADCHDPETMGLVITRPALKEALERRGKDVAALSHQEMRSLVCAQCHVEYYFKTDESRGLKAYLTFPWDKGLGAVDMSAYYQEAGFKDWVHPISGAPMIKMQHPDYEVYTQGVHAYRGVACADCHMPYRTEGGQKFSDHHIQSPLLNIANSCAVCHRWSEDEIRGRVESIQDSVHEGRRIAEAAIARAHFDIAACTQAGAGGDDLLAVRGLVREAQLRWDYVAANNGMGFHAPQACQRVLAEAADLAQECRLACARILAAKGVSGPVAYPDYATKEKAQALVKLFQGQAPPRLLPATAAVPATAP